METIRISIDTEEALMIVTALGTFQNRIGQHSSWAERKRIPFLQDRIANAASEDERKEAQGKLDWTNRYIARSIADGLRCNELKERIKQQAGITDEKRLGKV